MPESDGNSACILPTSYRFLSHYSFSEVSVRLGSKEIVYCEHRLALALISKVVRQDIFLSNSKITFADLALPFQINEAG